MSTEVDRHAAPRFPHVAPVLSSAVDPSVTDAKRDERDICSVTPSDVSAQSPAAWNKKQPSHTVPPVLLYIAPTLVTALLVPHDQHVHLTLKTNPLGHHRRRAGGAHARHSSSARQHPGGGVRSGSRALGAESGRHAGPARRDGSRGSGWPACWTLSWPRPGRGRPRR